MKISGKNEKNKKKDNFLTPARRRPPRWNWPTRQGRKPRRWQNSRERAEPLSLERGKKEKEKEKIRKKPKIAFK